MPELLEKGVSISELLGSKIFSFTFDFDEWPSNHHDGDDYMRPYNGSLFELRKSYRQIFHEGNFEIYDEEEGTGDAEEDGVEEIDSTKMFKISYKINILPMIDEHVVQ